VPPARVRRAMAGAAPRTQAVCRAAVRRDSVADLVCPQLGQCFSIDLRKGYVAGTNRSGRALRVAQAGSSGSWTASTVKGKSPGSPGKPDVLVDRAQDGRRYWPRPVGQEVALGGSSVLSERRDWGIMRGTAKWLAAAVGLCGACIAVALSAAAAGAPSAAQQRQAEAKIERQLVGSWRLLSFTARSASEVTYPYGKDAVGKLTYTRDGNMWALVARRGPAKNLPDANWYTGSFSVNLKRRTIVHHVRHASIPSWEGSDQLRPFKLKGRRLSLSTPPADAGAPTGVLKWDKVSRPARR